MHNALHFYKHHPAFLYAVFFLLGLSFALKYNACFLMAGFLISYPYVKKERSRLFPLLAFFLLAFLYGHMKKETFPPDQSSLRGVAFFVPSEIKWQANHFKKTKLVKGKIVSFFKDGKIKAQNIPCSIALSSSSPSMNSSFYIQGTLERKNKSYFSFDVEEGSPWTPHAYSFSLAEKRFQCKERFGKRIHQMFSERTVADFMTALTLGTLEDRMLKFEFGRLGLQHILAISGFHFGLCAWFLGLFFRIIPSQKIAHIALLLALTSYYLLLGNSPSILRAYLAISLYLVSKISNLRSKSLNLLGVVLLLEMLLNPCVISHLGFQLSFLATFAILFFLPITRNWMLKLLPKRALEATTSFSPLEKFVYLASCFLRSAFALNIAVTIWTLPVCLFHFHTFPVWSIFYNLFLPVAFALSLFLFFASLPFLILFPPLASLLSSCNELFTGKILQIIFQSPPFFHLSLRAPAFPSFLVVLILLLLFFFSLQKNQQQGLQFIPKKIV